MSNHTVGIWVNQDDREGKPGWWAEVIRDVGADDEVTLYSTGWHDTEYDAERDAEKWMQDNPRFVKGFRPV